MFEPKDSLSIAASVSRRGFLKTAAAAGIVGASAAGLSATGTLAPHRADAAADERIAYTFHQNHCQGHCSFKCTVREGKLCVIEPNDAWEDKRYATVCVKGISEVNHVYSTERIKTPLKRKEGAERGAGEFEAVSWDEAMAYFAESIKGVWNKYGQDAVVVATHNETGTRCPHLAKLMHSQAGGSGLIDQGVSGGFDPVIGSTGGYGFSSTEARDWVNSKTIINLGNNVLETGLVAGKTFFEAQEAGCKIITVDPHYTVTASKSDLWIPIVPGTDAALCLGMISAIIDNGWYDEDFMKEKTSFPFLVGEDGLLLHQEPGYTATTKGADNPFMVWDLATETAVPYTQEGVDCALEGTFTIDGMTYTTVFSKLKETQKPYTLAFAAEKTGIDEDTILELARTYALNSPSVIATGWGGSDKFANADISGHAEAILAALTANYGRKGAGLGVYLGGKSTGRSASLGSWPLPADAKTAPNKMPVPMVRGLADSSIHAYIGFGDRIQQGFANMHLTEQWVDSLDFICIVDIYHTTSCDYADLVLPAASKFETRCEMEAVKVTYGHVVGQGHVLDPLFDSKTDFEIEHAMLEALGLGGLTPETSYDLAKCMIETSKDPKLAGLTMEKFIENHLIYPIPGIEDPKKDWAVNLAKTRSGRLDVYTDALFAYNQALPTYEDPVEVYPGNPLAEKYPLQLSNARTKYHIHSMFGDAEWIRPFCDEYVELNPADMASRGLADGDKIRVFNDRGEFGCTVHASNMVRPGCARAFEGMWSKYMDSGNFQYVTNDYLNERNALLPLGAAMAMNDTLVEIEKA